jgi:DNA methylase/ParB-like nuclease domain
LSEGVGDCAKSLYFCSRHDTFSRKTLPIPEEVKMSHQNSAERIAPSPLAIVYRDIKDLTIDAHNPRRHSKRQVKQLAASIQAFGFNAPCLVDDNLQVVSGHGRIAAAQSLGMSKIPTISLGHLCPDQVRAFQIADNQLTLNSAWNKKLLAKNLASLRALDLNFSLDATGFEIGEIDLLVAEIEFGGEKRPIKEDYTDRVNSGAPVTQRGDLWFLGSHRLLCAESGSPSSYSLLMDGRKAEMVFTKIPTFVAESPGSEASHLHFIYQHSTSNALHFLVTPQCLLPSLLSAAPGEHFELQDVCVVIKPSACVGSLFRDQHELVLVLHAVNEDRFIAQRFNRPNVWRATPDHSSGGTSHRNSSKLTTSAMPVSLVAQAISDATDLGGLVLDPFLGIGTTLMAAEQVGRLCFAIEPDPTMVDRVIRTWETRTGIAAVQSRSGLTFGSVEEGHHGR